MDHHRGQIGIWKITVILGVLLGAHGIGIFFVVVPAPRLLDHPAAVLQNLNLALPLILDHPGNGFKRIQVLHLGAGSVFMGSRLPDRQIDIRPHGSLIQLAVRGPQILDRHAELFQIGDHLLRTPHIWFGYNLDQRHTRTVIIHQGSVLPIVVYEFSGILFHMDLMDAHLFPTRSCLNLHAAVDAYGKIELGDLIVLGIIGIEIIFPVKFTILVDVTVQGKSYRHGIFHYPSVQNRQTPRHAGTDRTGMGIGSSPECGGTAAEYFGLCSQLHMNLKSDHGFILLLHLLHPLLCS